MFVLVTRIEGNENFPCYAIYSDDSGRTWHASRTPAILGGDESKIAQLADGSLLMSIRNRFSGNRLFSRSTDRGLTWTPMPDDYADLHDVACTGDILTATTSPSVTMAANTSYSRSPTAPGAITSPSTTAPTAAAHGTNPSAWHPARAPTPP